jgi:hypothetical protein
MLVRRSIMHTDVARGSYGESVVEQARAGAPVRYAGDYLVGVTHERPRAFWEADGSGLGWREAAPFTTVRFNVLVADAGDGRFVPGLSVQLSAEQNGRTLAAGQCRFRWHPELHRYSVDIRLPEGSFDLTIRIAPAEFPRDDRVAGRRYGDPVVLRLPAVPVHPADMRSAM